ncbi:MAG: hypothetical protein H7Y15_07605 [Pseudonocardia sp.]|nr:hypothetical protein [Pseudonocardia sp.]
MTVAVAGVGRELDRLRIFVGAYGLDDAGRLSIAEAALGHHEWMCDLVGDGARSGVPGFAEYWTPEAASRADRMRRWLEGNSERIVAAVIADSDGSRPLPTADARGDADPPGDGAQRDRRLRTTLDQQPLSPPGRSRYAVAHPTRARCGCVG